MPSVLNRSPDVMIAALPTMTQKHTSPLRHSSPKVSAKQTGTTSRDDAKLTPATLPNLLKLSKIGKAVMKTVQTTAEGKTEPPRYTSQGHQCWSSLRVREWQEFQRLMAEEQEDDDDTRTATNDVPKTASSSAFFNTPSRSLSTRGSKRTLRKQLISADSDFYERARLEDFRRIESAYDYIKEDKVIRRRELLQGMPSLQDERIKPMKVKVIYDSDDHALKRQRKLRKFQQQQQQQQLEGSVSGGGESRLSSPMYKVKRRHSMQEPRVTTAASGSRRDQSPVAAGHTRVGSKSAGNRIAEQFTFPKASDFVPDSGTKIDPVGVGWKYSKCHTESDKKTDNVHRAFSAPGPQNRAQPNLGLPKLHKASFLPVTEALKREGISTSKQKGRVIHTGEMNVTKVWKRKLTNIIIPVHMAKRDIPDNFMTRGNDGKQHEGMADRQEDDDDISDDRRSMSRPHSSPVDEQGESTAS